MVPNRKPATKESKTFSSKKSLREVAGTMLSDLLEKAREERMMASRQKQQEQEDEIAVMTFGPNWKEEPTNITKLTLVPSYDSDADAAE